MDRVDLVDQVDQVDQVDHVNQLDQVTSILAYQVYQLTSIPGPTSVLVVSHPISPYNMLCYAFGVGCDGKAGAHTDRCRNHRTIGDIHARVAEDLTS